VIVVQVVRSVKVSACDAPGGVVFLYVRGDGSAHVMTLEHDAGEGTGSLRGVEFSSVAGGWRGFHTCVALFGGSLVACACEACVPVAVAA
jgi:hypothetical protein